MAGRELVAAKSMVDPWGTPYMLWSDLRTVEIAWRSAGPDRAFHTADDFTWTWWGQDLYEALPERLKRFYLFVRLNMEPETVVVD